MVLRTLTPNLMVEDIDETVAWYEDVLDAQVAATLQTDEGDSWWAQIVVNDVTIMFQTRDSLVDEFPEMEGESGPGSTVLYVGVSDIQYQYDTLDNAGASIVQDLQRTEHGQRQFAIEDCNDYILWFAENVTNEPEGPIIR